MADEPLVTVITPVKNLVENEKMEVQNEKKLLQKVYEGKPGKTVLKLYNRKGGGGK